MGTCRSNNLIPRIKERLTIREVVDRYGLPVKRGFICCPFHSERTPSLKLYENNTWYCFGCGAHGDVIDFVSKMEGKTFSETIRSLALEMGLGASEFSAIDYSNYLKNKRIKARRAAQGEWIKKARLSISFSLRNAREIMSKGEQTDEFFRALQSISRLEYLSEALEDDPEKVMNENKEEVDGWILKSSSQQTNC